MRSYWEKFIRWNCILCMYRATSSVKELVLLALINSGEESPWQLDGNSANSPLNWVHGMKVFRSWTCLLLMQVNTFSFNTCWRSSFRNGLHQLLNKTHNLWLYLCMKLSYRSSWEFSSKVFSPTAVAYLDVENYMLNLPKFCCAQSSAVINVIGCELTFIGANYQN